MYGLVNKAIKNLALASGGADCWSAITKVAELDDDHFLSMEAYPDELTVQLVSAASEVLGLTSEEVFRRFGRYWVLYTAAEGYGTMLQQTGSNVREFLANLDMLHSRVSTQLPELRPPSFEVEDGSEPNQILLYYYSERAGLTPMVCGLIEGVGEMFSTDLTIKQLKQKEALQDPDVFEITLSP